MSFRAKKNDKFQRGRNYKKAWPSKKGGGSGGGGSINGGGGGGQASFGGGKQWTPGERDAFIKEKRADALELDTKFGYALHDEGPARLGWLFNMCPTAVEEGGMELSAVELYFLQQDASTFKAIFIYQPYFYVGVSDSRFCSDVAGLLTRRFSDSHVVVEVADKEDLDLANHLAGHQRRYLKLKFNNVGDLMEVRKQLSPMIDANQSKHEKGGAYQLGGDAMAASSSAAASSSSKASKGSGIGGGFIGSSGGAKADQGPEDFFELLTEMREFDVTYYMRTSIDLELRCGMWYLVHAPIGEAGAAAGATGSSRDTDDDMDQDASSSSSSSVGVAGEGEDDLEERALAAAQAAAHPKSNVMQIQRDMMVKAEPKVLAFDIECTKEPLKFPQAERDQIFMISYMLDTQGYLIISRDVVGEDIDDFEYTPKPGMEGPFTVFNERNEEALLRRFFTEVQTARPQIFVTYNGDFFDWPFVEKRASVHGMSMAKMIGIFSSERDGGGYRGRCAAHLDCMAWVNRDSYLPQGSRSLKAVTKAKLGYDPVEVDPEDMVRFAAEQPKHMASYSVSDAVATYYLYQRYIHDFIFALCTIIPLGPEDVLNKGSGTLCESLLMIEAFRENIICPNKEKEPPAAFFKGHLLEAETYVGGHVEALETGVYRADFEYDFDINPDTVSKLIRSVDQDLAFALEVENGVDRSEVSNYEEVRQAIIEKLEMLRDTPKRHEKPFIYHLDVAAMYPNIILTNRLQPSSMVTQHDCAACDFNTADSNCKRKMSWIWRGDFTPATQSEYQMIKTQLTYENVQDDSGFGGRKPFVELTPREQEARIKQRLKGYAQKVYKKTKTTEEAPRTDTVCMRENPFYVNTVRAFRDRRYDFKKLTKTWKKNKGKAAASGDALAHKQAEDKETLYDSLQLAHKCILNSFYGYVMRKGARWRSMSMAAIVTTTGAELIKQARELVENIGRPLELDTDGIWCILPSSFPEDFTFKTKGGDKVGISYPCVMLNAQVHDKFTNHQYQDLKDPATRKFSQKSECSIFFEVDGPYKAMILPASTEEGKLLKKRYAVFEMDGSLAELKGFEMKRRGELEVIKAFQQQVFDQFLEGDTLEACYDAVADVANNWLDVLDTKGEELDDAELIDLISENRTISGMVSDYEEGRKMTSLTTGQRLADFLGAEMLADKGLNCKLVIANRPYGCPVTDRAIPTMIFKAEPAVRKYWLQKWLKTTQSVELRDVIDWPYYTDRLGKTIQKIITIPAALQFVPNPVPRVAHPDWLQRKVREASARHAQTKITAVFKKLPPGEKFSSPHRALKTASSKISPESVVMDIEDIGSPGASKGVSGPAGQKTALVLSKKGSRIGLDSPAVVAAASAVSAANRVYFDPAAKSFNEKKALQMAGANAPKKPLSAYMLWFNGVAGEVDAVTLEAGGARRRIMKANPEFKIGDVGKAGGAEWKAMSEEQKAPYYEKNKELKMAYRINLAAAAETARVAKAEEAANPGKSLPETCPPMKEDFEGWMAYRKHQWRQLRKCKKEERAVTLRGARSGTFDTNAAFGASSAKAAATAAEASYAAAASAIRSEVAMGGKKGGLGVADMLLSAQRGVTHSHWQIIECFSSEAPGEFVVWAMTGEKQLQKISLEVPKTFYLNSRMDPKESTLHELTQALGARKVSRNLPRAARQHHLYELCMPERRYLRHEKSIATIVSHGDVQGVYETATPSWFRALLALGCVSTLGDQRRKDEEALAVRRSRLTLRQRQQGIQANKDTADLPALGLGDMKFVTTTPHGYLHPAVAQFKRIFLYHSQSETGGEGRAITALFFIDGTNSAVEPEAPIPSDNSGRAVLPGARAAIWISNPRQMRGVQESRPPFKRLLKESLASPEYKSQIGAAPIEFSSTFTKSPAASFKAAVEALRKYSSERNGPTVVVAQTPFSPAVLRRKMPTLGADFPVVRMASHRADQQYPAMQWHIHGARTVVERYLQMPNWMRLRLQCARYAHVPLGNLGDDPVCTMVDVFFARLMQHNRHLLWASESGHPDLGGVEGDENDIWADEDRPEPVCVPGAYRNVCVELDVLNLCVDSIVASSQLDALDGGQGFSALDVNVAGAKAAGGADGAMDEDGSGDFGGQQQQQTGSAAIGDGAACASAFRVLKAMVQNWLGDVTRTGNPHADTLLIHLHRYLNARESLLYDPALKRVIAGLMRKVFLRLVSEIRRLGAEVVHADFGKLIIATNRTDLRQAVEYTRFIMETITASPVFEFIHIEPSKYWESLLFLDEQNYAGIEVSLQSLDNPDETESSSSSTSSSSSLVESASGESTSLMRAASNDSIDEDDAAEQDEEENDNGAPSDSEAAGAAAEGDSSAGTKKARMIDELELNDEEAASSCNSEDKNAAAFLLYVADVKETTKTEMEDAALALELEGKKVPPVTDSAVDAELESRWAAMDGDEKEPYLENLGTEEEEETNATKDEDDDAMVNNNNNNNNDDDDDDDDDDIVAMVSRRKRKGASVTSQLQRRRAMNSQLSDSDSDESGGEEDPLSQHAGTWDDEGDGVLHYGDDEDENGKAASDGEAGAVEEEYDDGPLDGPRFDSHWDIAEYLPDEVREYFLIVVSQFLYKPWERATELKAEHEQRIQDMSNQLNRRDTFGSGRDSFGGGSLLSQGAAGLTQTIDQVEKDDEETMRVYLQNLVSKKLLKLMLRAVQEISDYSSNDAASRFPNRAGSFRTDLKNPALEFIKAVCRVVSLDGTVSDEVQRLRRSLLAQVGSREFSDEAAFKEMGLSYVLPDVICGFCNHAHDLDLCRDPSVNLPEKRDRFSCANCASPYDKDNLELRLVEAVQRRSTKYQLQDLRCVKCHKVSTRQMAFRCHCSGKLVTDDTPDSFAQEMRTIVKIAHFHGFDWLGEVVKNLSH